MITVLGPGAVGGLVAALLKRAGNDATVVARPSTARLIQNRGLCVRSALFGDFIGHPHTLTQLDSDDDVLIVATKSPGLHGAIARVTSTPSLVLPLLNGIEHMPVLRARFGAHVIAGTITMGAHRPEPGVVVHSSPVVRIRITNPSSPQQSRTVRSLAASLNGAGIDTTVSGSEPQILWSKLVRLTALACTTSASGLLLGAIRDDPAWHARLSQAVVETATVARAEGAPEDPLLALEDLARFEPCLSSSMARDIEAGRESEFDAIAGAVLRAGRRHGIVLPTIEALVAEVVERAGVAPPRW